MTTCQIPRAPSESPPRPLTEAQAVGIDFLWPEDNQAQEAAMARRGILLCREGQAIAKPLAAPPAETPADPLEGAPAEPAALLSPAPSPNLRLGEGVAWDEVMGVYVARRSGHVRLLHGRLDVLEQLEWVNDLDASTGPFTFGGDIGLNRGVLDLAVVRCGRDLSVRDCVEAADVQAARDITVHHGICGKEKGVVRAGGSLSARFLTNARIIADGNVTVENEVDNSHIRCGGELHVDHGTILGGHALAQAGIYCHTAGSPAGVKTILELGVPEEQRLEIRQVTESLAIRRQRATEIRRAVEPLMARQKNLTAAQKEKATELLFSADQMESEAQELAQKLETLKAPLDAALELAIHVTGFLHPGVIIRYASWQAGTPDGLRGPLTIKLITRGTQRAIAYCHHNSNDWINLAPIVEGSHPKAPVS